MRGSKNRKSKYERKTQSRHRHGLIIRYAEPSSIHKTITAKKERIVHIVDSTMQTKQSNLNVKLKANRTQPTHQTHDRNNNGRKKEKTKTGKNGMKRGEHEKKYEKLLTKISR